jgi:hypothetical protein
MTKVRYQFQGDYRVFKIYPLPQYLNKKFQNLCLPGKNITLDEYPLLWTGTYSFAKHTPLKDAVRGIQHFKLCKSSTEHL